MEVLHAGGGDLPEEAADAVGSGLLLPFQAPGEGDLLSQVAFRVFREEAGGYQDLSLPGEASGCYILRCDIGREAGQVLEGVFFLSCCDFEVGEAGAAPGFLQEADLGDGFQFLQICLFKGFLFRHHEAAGVGGLTPSPFFSFHVHFHHQGVDILVHGACHVFLHPAADAEHEDDAGDADGGA